MFMVTPVLSVWKLFSTSFKKRICEYYWFAVFSVKNIQFFNTGDIEYLMSEHLGPSAIQMPFYWGTKMYTLLLSMKICWFRGRGHLHFCETTLLLIVFYNNMMFKKKIDQVYSRKKKKKKIMSRMSRCSNTNLLCEVC